MLKAVIGGVILLLFIWFLRRAWTFFRGRREVDNAQANLDRMEDMLQVQKLERKAEEIQNEIQSESNQTLTAGDKNELS